jgi:hypothetical protein
MDEFNFPGMQMNPSIVVGAREAIFYISFNVAPDLVS